MNNLGLYAVFLWGKLLKNSLIEDHSLVFVVADDEKSARKIAKTKWNAIDVHVDWTQKIESIDWYRISLVKTEKKEDITEINSEYSA